MLPVKKIICPTDFSDPSYEALKIADEMARHFSSELVLIHAVTPLQVDPIYAEPNTFDLPSFEKERQVIAEKAIEKLAAEKLSAGIQHKTLVVQGDAAYQIVELAEEENADLIVIATHGNTGWRKVIFGSVTARVIRMAKCPVLSIKIKDESD